MELRLGCVEVGIPPFPHGICQNMHTYILVVAGATLNIDNVSQKVHDIENSLVFFFCFFCIYLTFFVLIPS